MDSLLDDIARHREEHEDLENGEQADQAVEDIKQGAYMSF